MYILNILLLFHFILGPFGEIIPKIVSIFYVYKFFMYTKMNLIGNRYVLLDYLEKSLTRVVEHRTIKSTRTQLRATTIFQQPRFSN